MVLASFMFSKDMSSNLKVFQILGHIFRVLSNALWPKRCIAVLICFLVGYICLVGMHWCQTLPSLIACMLTCYSVRAVKGFMRCGEEN